jgi:hypothetical protein
VQSYHVSGRPGGVPDPDALPGTALLALLEQRDARQVLHVTFGSALRATATRSARSSGPTTPPTAPRSAATSSATWRRSPYPPSGGVRMNGFDLAGRVAVVTGGAGTLGLAMARGLGRAGARVALVSRRQGAIDDAAARLREEGIEALGVGADVLDPAALAEAARAVDDAWGRVDVLLTAAGGNRPDAVVFGDRDLFGSRPRPSGRWSS